MQGAYRLNRGDRRSRSDGRWGGDDDVSARPVATAILAQPMARRAQVRLCLVVNERFVKGPAPGNATGTALAEAPGNGTANARAS